MILRRILILTSAGVLTLAAAVPAFAERNDTERNGDIAAAMAAPVTLTQAIVTAESETGGRAIEADYENLKGVTTVIVHLVKDGAVTRARIDAKSGEMVATLASDEEDDGDDE